ncbi:HEPARAN-ALPHA-GLUCOSAMINIDE N-ACETYLTRANSFERASE-LIKE ISOFORM X1 [Salix koriyanagi]|uniref:HEPARAN-ALPHA-GLUCOSAMINIDE N-ACETYLTRANSFERASE-LIKE ISOFORM X1 n=1 Tax=Salix koriyanagi TaxID=2511006 RepID=A0A9Q0Z0J8_9ROSI|nr:HEPARAN-ALPHA-GLUCOSAMINIDE N-ACETYLTRANSFERASE-LIKE ISOFORM X1 [Salix koriyanagi]
MADLLHKPLLDIEEQSRTSKKSPRVASLDVFRGLCVLLMMLVDYCGAIIPIIAHSPRNGLHLADSVMPFFLFIAGVSLALVYKKVPNRIEATWKAVLRAVKLFLLGVVIQGDYFHGINSLTYGVDMKRIRWLGIFAGSDSLTSCSFHSVYYARGFLTCGGCHSSQKISVGYVAAALCEIWLSCRARREVSFLKRYCWHWCVAFSLSAIYLGLLYGLYVPDWQFEMSSETSSVSPKNHSYVYTVKCSLRGDLGPACNSAGMIDRYVLGIDHLYKKPVYRNLKKDIFLVQITLCHRSLTRVPFDLLTKIVSTASYTAAVTCIIGLQYGHLLAHPQGRMENWTLFSFSLLVVGLLLAVIGDPVNKSLYTISYTLITSASAGITYSALYLLVDVCGYRCLTFGLEWMGKHSLIIFVLVTSNSAVISTQGFYWAAPENNMIHWMVYFCDVHADSTRRTMQVHHIRIFLDDGNCELVSGPSLRARILVNVLKSTIITLVNVLKSTIITLVCPMDRPNDLNIRSLTRAFSDI